MAYNRAQEKARYQKHKSRGQRNGLNIPLTMVYVKPEPKRVAFPAYLEAQTVLPQQKYIGVTGDEIEINSPKPDRSIVVNKPRVDGEVVTPNGVALLFRDTIADKT